MSVGGKPVHKRKTPCIPRLFAHQSGYPIQSGVESRQELLFGAAVFTSSPCGIRSSEAGKKDWEVIQILGEGGKRDPSFLQAVGPFSSTHTSCNQT